MQKMKALDTATDRSTDETQLVYHWTDDPGDPGPNDYHIVSLGDYLCDPSAAWIPESAVIFSTCEGWY